MLEITSLSNPKIKETVKLRDNQYRRSTGKFLIDGNREIDRAIRHHIRILEVFAEKNALESFRQTHKTLNFASYQVTKPVLHKIAFGERNEGLVAVAEEPDCSLEVFETKLDAVQDAGKMPLLAVAEGIEKPGNLGAVFRSADGAGLDGIIVADSPVDPFYSNAIRNSAGTVFRLPMVKMNTVSTIDFLRRKKISIAVTRCDGAVPHTDYDFRRPTAIVMGSEADGLSDAWIADDMVPISLPMLGIADSLNISVAAAVLFYEARRQRGIHDPCPDSVRK